MEKNDIPQEKWKGIIETIPIVSIDLIPFYNGGLVLVKRVNEPAKNEWFVPGGRLIKNEKLDEAVHRIAQKELGIKVKVEGRLGIYEHMYEISEVKEVRSKHYVVIAYVCTVVDNDFSLDGQHDEVRVFHDLPEGLHEYVKDYFRDLKKDSKFNFKAVQSFKE